MFFGLFETKREAKEKLKKEYDEIMIKAQEEEVKEKKEAERLEKEMMSKRCPFRRDFCSKNCIHFREAEYSEAKVELSTIYHPHIWVRNMNSPTPPSCKLWR